MFTCVKLMGYLFDRSSFDVCDLVVAICDLVDFEHKLPEEHQIQCLLELLPIVGESNCRAQSEFPSECLQDLNEMTRLLSDGLQYLNDMMRLNPPRYSVPLVDKLTDVLAMQEQGWPMPMVVVQVVDTCLDVDTVGEQGWPMPTFIVEMIKGTTISG